MMGLLSPPAGLGFKLPTGCDKFISPSKPSAKAESKVRSSPRLLAEAIRRQGFQPTRPLGGWLSIGR